jgi:YesN/AraC family two-component response regulator
MVTFITVIIILLSAVLYNRYTEILTRQIYKTENENLNRIKSEFDNITDTLARVSFVLGHSEQVNGFFTRQEELTPYDMNLLRQMVQREISNASYIDPLYLLNTEGKSFYISNIGMSSAILFENKNLGDQQIFEIISDFGPYRYHQPILRGLKTSQEIFGSPREKYFLTQVYSPQPLPVNSLKYAVVVNIPAENLTKQFTGLSSKVAVLIIQNGKVIGSSDSKQFPLMKNSSELLDITRIESVGAEQGYYVEFRLSEKTIIVWCRDTRKDRIYVIAIPYSKIMSQLNALSKGIITICGMVLMGGIILALFLSIKINAPIWKLYQITQNLSKGPITDGIMLRQELLWRMIHDEMIDNFTSGNYFRVDLSRVRAMAILELESGGHEEEISNAKQKTLFASSIQVNLETELSGISYEICAVSWRRCVIIFGSENEKTEDSKIRDEILKNACKAAKEKLSRILSIPVTAVFLVVEKDIERLPVIYSRVVDMLRYRLYYGPGAFIGQEEMAVIHPLNYEIFRKKMRKLREAMEKLHSGECWEIFMEIMELLHFVTYEEYSASILNIAMELTAILENYNLSSAYSFPGIKSDHFISAVSRMDSLKEVESSFYRIFEGLGKIQIRDNAKNYQRAMETKAYIDEYYGDPNLYAVSLAEHFGVSPSYLGRIFYKYTQTTLNGYLAEVRIMRSKQLLENSKISIGNVSEKVGFSNVKYFYKVFKDFTDTTPKKWRQQKAMDGKIGENKERNPHDKE